MSIMIVDPYRFAANGPAGDVTIVVQDFGTGGTTGSFDYTTTALTGVTPKAVFVFGSEALVSSGSAETAGAQISVTGIVSGAEFGLATGSRNGTTTTSVARTLQFDNSASPLKIDDIDVLGDQVSANPSLISGGININYSANDLDFKMHYMAFAGPDLSVALDYLEMPSNTTPVDVTTVGFEPDLVIFFGAMVTAGVQQAFMGFVFGVAHNDGTQRCFMMQEQDAQADATPYMAILTNRAAGQINGTGTGALDYDITIGSFDASGFTATQSADPAGDDLAFIALASPRRYKIFDITTPTSTGNQSITGIGFEPQAVLLLLSTLTATDPSFPLTSGATMSAFSISTIADEVWSTAYRTQAGAATMNTASNCQNEILHPSGTSTNAGRATLVSFDSDGFTINWSAVQGSATKGFGIAFE